MSRRPRFARTLAALVLGLVTFALDSAAQQATPLFGGGQTTMLRGVRGPHAGQFVVPLNQSQMLRLDHRFREVAVGNSEIADVVPVSENMVYVLGKKLGATTLMFTGDSGQALAIADLVVSYDIEGLKRKLYELIPDETIDIRPANDAIVLSGRVSSSDRLARAVAVAEQYAPKKVTNLLTVSGSQQVMLEVRFAEVDREYLKSVAISQAFINTGSDFAMTILTGPFGLLGTDLNPFTTITSVERTGIGTFAQQIDLLERKGLVTVLAEPNLVVLSGDTAKFLAGGEFPIPVAQTGSALGATAITVEFKQFGVGLNFTPTVVSSDLMNLVLKTEVSDIDRALSVISTFPGGVQIPGLRVRRAESTVEVRDGQSFAIAGMLRHDFDDSIEQFPWVGDVPVLGALFRSPRYRQHKTELVVFITPRLVQPVLAHNLELPTDNLVLPSESDLFLFSRTEGRTGSGPTMTTRPTGGGFSGAAGYILQ